MGRPIASVHVDIARFVHEVGKLHSDSQLAMWTRNLAECLALRDPLKSEYGAFLLEEVEEFRKADLERKRGRQGSTESKESADSEESRESHPRSDQGRSEQLEQINGVRENHARSTIEDEIWKSRAQATFDFYPETAGKDGASVRKTGRDIARLAILIEKFPHHKWEQHAFLERKIAGQTPYKLSKWIDQQPDQAGYKSLSTRAKKLGLTFPGNKAEASS